MKFLNSIHTLSHTAALLSEVFASWRLASFLTPALHIFLCDSITQHCTYFLRVSIQHRLHLAAASTCYKPTQQTKRTSREEEQQNGRTQQNILSFQADCRHQEDDITGCWITGIKWQFCTGNTTLVSDEAVTSKHTKCRGNKLGYMYVSVLVQYDLEYEPSRALFYMKVYFSIWCKTP